MEQLLPKYFRHDKFESFARQLNWYGFSKRNYKNHNSYVHPDLELGMKYFSFYSVFLKSGQEENFKINFYVKRSSYHSSQLCCLIPNNKTWLWRVLTLTQHPYPNFWPLFPCSFCTLKVASVSIEKWALVMILFFFSFF